MGGHLRTLFSADAEIKGLVSLSLFSMTVLVDGVCTVANCVGKELAPHVKKHGSKLVPESLKRDKDGKSTLDGAMVVAASSVQGNGGLGLSCLCLLCSGGALGYLSSSAGCCSRETDGPVFTGFSTVWQGLECAAKCIVNNVSAETVQTVRYK